MTDYEDRALAVLAGLRAAEGITVYEEEAGSLATWLTGPEYTLDLIGRAAGLSLPPSMGRNFHRCDGLHSYWRAARQPAVGGEFFLDHLAGVCVVEVPAHVSEADWPLRERPGVGCSQDVFGPDGEELVVRTFDAHASGDGASAGFREDEDGAVALDGGQPEIWYAVSTEYSLLRLDLTYPEYLDALLLTRGLLNWQYLYADPHDPGFGPASAQLGPGLDFLERTFPRDDFSALRSRWESHARAQATRG